MEEQTIRQKITFCRGISQVLMLNMYYWQYLRTEKQQNPKECGENSGVTATDLLIQEFVSDYITVENSPYHFPLTWEHDTIYFII